MFSLPSAQETIGVAYENVRESVIDTFEKAKEVVTETIYPLNSSSNLTPPPPHGVPPSDTCQQGKVAYEDKTFTGKLTENLENIQSSVSSLGRPSLEELINLQTEDIPQPPHGVPPSDNDHCGIVADQDKPILDRVSDRIPSLLSYSPILPLPAWTDYKQEINAFYESFPQSFSETVNLAKRKIGLSYSVDAGTVPQPPHGVPPSDSNRGRVSETDKPVQRQLEENWDMLRCEFLTVWNQSKRKLGWNWIQPGTVPEPPRGVAPSQGSSSGVVDDRDKLLSARIEEAAAQLREEVIRGLQTTASVMADTSNQVSAKAESLVNQGGRALGMSYQVKEGSVPQPPHGFPPSDGIGVGIVAEEDKSIPQKVGEAWDQLNNDRSVVETTSALTGGYL